MSEIVPSMFTRPRGALTALALCVVASACTTAPAPAQIVELSESERTLLAELGLTEIVSTGGHVQLSGTTTAEATIRADGTVAVVHEGTFAFEAPHGDQVTVRCGERTAEYAIGEEGLSAMGEGFDPADVARCSVPLEVSRILGLAWRRAHLDAVIEQSLSSCGARSCQSRETYVYSGGCTRCLDTLPQINCFGPEDSGGSYPSVPCLDENQWCRENTITWSCGRSGCAERPNWISWSCQFQGKGCTTDLSGLSGEEELWCNPCDGSDDPCCGSSDPCCGSGDPCCGSTDPCCGSTDPCCGSDDPCCGSGNPCCGSTDPCCGSVDECCGSTDPCCGSNDECCGNPDPCCSSGDPCCGSSDPCCGSGDPCCGVYCPTSYECVGGDCVFTDVVILCGGEYGDCEAGEVCINGNCRPEL
jgi:hypothetical protein